MFSTQQNQFYIFSFLFKELVSFCTLILPEISIVLILYWCSFVLTLFSSLFNYQKLLKSTVIMTFKMYPHFNESGQFDVFQFFQIGYCLLLVLQFWIETTERWYVFIVMFIKLDSRMVSTLLWNTCSFRQVRWLGITLEALST